jgi:GNAT superfamily N-acetyltransferase
MFDLRLATLDDVPAIQALMRESVEGLSAAYYTLTQSADAARYLTIPDPDIIQDGTYYVVEDAARLVGCGGWSRRRKLFTGSTGEELLSADFLDPAIEPARIRAFFVAPTHARRGIARSIYAECESAARRLGFRSFELMATLPGVPLYSSLGFQSEAKVDIVLPNNNLLPGVRMRKSFTD